MQKEVQAADTMLGLGPQAAQEPTRNTDQVSKAGSSVSKPVAQSNIDSLNEFRSQLGLIQKSRPKDFSKTLDVAVATPVIEEADMDAVSTTNMAAPEQDSAGGSYVELIRYFNQLDIDMRELSQLRTCFIGNDKSSLK